MLNIPSSQTNNSEAFALDSVKFAVLLAKFLEKGTHENS